VDGLNVSLVRLDRRVERWGTAPQLPRHLLLMRAPSGGAMKKEIKGSGITQRTYESLDHDTINADVAYLKDAFDKTIQAGDFFKRVLTEACKLLTAAELPVCVVVRYQRKQPEKWKPMPLLAAHLCEPGTERKGVSIIETFKERTYC
jgi:hypothetical protein